MGHLLGGLSSTQVPRLVLAPGSRATPPAGTRAARHPGQRATRAATPSGPTPGRRRVAFSMACAEPLLIPPPH